MGLFAMRRGLPVLVIVALALVGCSDPDLGFAVELSLIYDSSVDDAALARVATVTIAADGDERYSRTLVLNRPALRLEKLVYLPGSETRSLTFSVSAADAAQATIAQGGTATQVLTPGKTAHLDVFLMGAATEDGGVPDASVLDASVLDASGLDASGLDGGAADLSTFDAATPAITYVQKSEVSQLSGISISTPPFAAAPVNGDTIICFINYAGTSINVLSLSDTKGNTYDKAVGPVRASGWSDEIWYAANITGGSGLTVTATFSSGGNGSISCHEYAGIRAVAPIDQALSSNFTGSGLRTLGPVTTVQPVELIFSTFTVAGSVTNGGSFTIRSTVDGDLVQDKGVTSIGSYSTTATCNAECNGTAVFFKSQ